MRIPFFCAFSSIISILGPAVSFFFFLRNNYNMLLILQLELFLSRPSSILHIKSTNLATKPLTDPLFFCLGEL